MKNFFATILFIASWGLIGFAYSEYISLDYSGSGSAAASLSSAIGFKEFSSVDYEIDGAKILSKGRDIAGLSLGENIFSLGILDDFVDTVYEFPYPEHVGKKNIFNKPSGMNEVSDGKDVKKVNTYEIYLRLSKDGVAPSLKMAKEMVSKVANDDNGGGGGNVPGGVEGFAELEEFASGFGEFTGGGAVQDSIGESGGSTGGAMLQDDVNENIAEGDVGSSGTGVNSGDSGAQGASSSGRSASGEGASDFYELPKVSGLLVSLRAGITLSADENNGWFSFDVCDDGIMNDIPGNPSPSFKSEYDSINSKLNIPGYGVFPVQCKALNTNIRDQGAPDSVSSGDAFLKSKYVIWVPQGKVLDSGEGVFEGAYCVDSDGESDSFRIKDYGIGFPVAATEPASGPDTIGGSVQVVSPDAYTCEQVFAGAEGWLR